MPFAGVAPPDGTGRRRAFAHAPFVRAGACGIVLSAKLTHMHPLDPRIGLNSEVPPPLRIRTRPLLGTYRLTLCGIVRDEIFFLPRFLEHYRRLGVDRFIFLDDHSSDGSAEYLADEPDVMIVESDLRYSDRLDYGASDSERIMEARTVRFWRDQLANQFCVDQWMIVADADEFLCLADGALPRLVRALGEEGAEALWGAMIDMYPRMLRDLDREADRFDPGAEWFFDARPHIDPRRPVGRFRVPRTLYSGSVARLFSAWQVLPQGNALRRLRRRLTGRIYRPHTLNYKTPLMLWRLGDYFVNCHITSKLPSERELIGILHFKFTPDLRRKIGYALASRSYDRGSRTYDHYAVLLERMQRADASFLAKISRQYRSPDDLMRAGLVTSVGDGRDAPSSA